MSWVMKRVARCDECGFEWIPTSESPSQCPSRKCRKRTWNKLEGRKEFEDFTTNSPVTVEDAKELVPVITAKPVDGSNRVRKGKRSVEVQEPAVEPTDDEIEHLMGAAPDPTPSIPMCPFETINRDTGEKWRCDSLVHDWKVPHHMVRNGDIYD